MTQRGALAAYAGGQKILFGQWKHFDFGLRRLNFQIPHAD